MKTLLTVTVVLLSLTAIAQPQKKSVVIGSMITRPNALLIVNPEHADQGVLLPQLSTAQRMSMQPASPSEDGLIVYDTTQKSYYYWSDGKWVKFNVEHPRSAHYYSIDPVAFRQLHPDNDLRHNNIVVFETDNAFVTAARSGLGEQIIAPISLPDGVTIEAITFYYMDNDDDNLKISLVRKSLSGSSEKIINWESSGTSASVEGATLTDVASIGEIDLQNYTYRILVEFAIDEEDEIGTPAQATQRLYGVSIKYHE